MNHTDTLRCQNYAAAYGRMFTEHQQYSIGNQMHAIRKYAKRRGLEIVEEYSDVNRTHATAKASAPEDSSANTTPNA